MNYDFNFPIGSNSIVFDCGGWTGAFAKKINEMYGSTVYVFEPIKEHYDLIKKIENDKIIAFNYGVGAYTRKEVISIRADSSSIFLPGEIKQIIDIRAMSEILDDLKLDFVDLLGVNIEGGEYELLDKLIEDGSITKFDNVEIQFHRVIPDAETRRQNIIDGLSKTHNILNENPFFWDNFKLKCQ
jgi:FkbM family methyltransferase